MFHWIKSKNLWFDIPDASIDKDVISDVLKPLEILKQRYILFHKNTSPFLNDIDYHQKFYDPLLSLRTSLTFLYISDSLFQFFCICLPEIVFEILFSDKTNLVWSVSEYSHVIADSKEIYIWLLFQRNRQKGPYCLSRLKSMVWLTILPQLYRNRIWSLCCQQLLELIPCLHHLLHIFQFRPLRKTVHFLPLSQVVLLGYLQPLELSLSLCLYDPRFPLLTINLQFLKNWPILV